MKPLLLEVRAPATQFAPLIVAARTAGHRVGWLDLEGPVEPPEALAAAVDAGVLRAVGVTATGVVSAKGPRGGLVLRDLLREHFRGCRLVLVAGRHAGARIGPLLEPDGGGWSVTPEEGPKGLFGTEGFVGRLSKARPFG